MWKRREPNTGFRMPTDEDGGASVAAGSKRGAQIRAEVRGGAQQRRRLEGVNVNEQGGEEASQMSGLTSTTPSVASDSGGVLGEEEIIEDDIAIEQKAERKARTILDAMIEGKDYVRDELYRDVKLFMYSDEWELSGQLGKKVCRKGLRLRTSHRNTVENYQKHSIAKVMKVTFMNKRNNTTKDVKKRLLEGKNERVLTLISNGLSRHFDIAHTTLLILLCTRFPNAAC